MKFKFSVSYGVRSQLGETFHFSMYIFRYTEYYIGFLRLVPYAAAGVAVEVFKTHRSGDDTRDEAALHREGR